MKIDDFAIKSGAIQELSPDDLAGVNGGMGNTNENIYNLDNEIVQTVILEIAKLQKRRFNCDVDTTVIKILESCTDWKLDHDSVYEFISKRWSMI